ncbi:DUF6415 family natural product biosynthesis protein [Streptomyces aurantiacus]|uniref:Uncharacterized protein n=2 Tax=Streptomyces aurantiacus TaxID=47760 RepID=A0A7G1P407_9ACTN|nr:DUF6415 family natural product biosynthesis protein [Streptomyces aurantiacus]BCL28574.1 hypothetical protein GCM10017557_34330 [Streptomyces aurantiacus]
MSARWIAVQPLATRERGVKATTVGAASLRRAWPQTTRDVFASCHDADVSDEVAEVWGRAVHAGFDSTRIREGVRTAKSWKQAGVSPHPRTLVAVTRALTGYLTSLVPYVSLHLETLTPGSRAWASCREAIERSHEARDAAPSEGVQAAGEHAFRLAVQTEVLLRYAEQHTEQSGE